MGCRKSFKEFCKIHDVELTLFIAPVHISLLYAVKNDKNTYAVFKYYSHKLQDNHELATEINHINTVKKTSERSGYRLYRQVRVLHLCR